MIDIRGNNAILSYITINNANTRGISISADNCVIDNTKIENIVGTAIDINGDSCIVKDTTIKNINGGDRTGIETGSRLEGTYISGCNISGVAFGKS